MEYYRSESAFIDSLDFLSPPVKRVGNSRGLFGYSYNAEPNSVQLFRSFRNKFTSKDRGVEYKQERVRQRNPRRIVKTGGESSTSLVLKKTSERKILRRYTVLSYTSLHSSNLNKTASGGTSSRLESKGKPLIKVTVIPKTDHIQTAKLLRKRRNIPKRVQSTPSNQENSVKTKNLYLVVAGRRNKIYEIKTTGSATFSSDQTDSVFYSKNDISIERLSNVKHLIQSLDMDQKQKKVKKEIKIDEQEKATLASKGHDPYYYESKRIDSYESEGHVYSDNLASGKRSSNRSRVRIYGQLGLTDDDRYVLRYGATVNDKPVTDFAQLTQDFLPQVHPASGYSPYETNPEKESQGTQVNFNTTVLARNQFKNAKVDKNVQCTCNKGLEYSNSENRFAINPLKNGSSPLVIISVFPKQNPEEIIKYTSDNHHPKQCADTHVQHEPKLKADKGTNKKTMDKADESKEKKIIPIKKYNKRSPGIRSSSPTKNILKRIPPENKKETIVLKTQTDTNADHYKATRVLSNKVLQKGKGTADVPTTSKIGVRNLKSVQRSRSPLKKNNPTRTQEKGTNTDPATPKKDLVDNYMKQLNSQMCQRDKIPVRENNSKVTINIEGEQEYYNVLLDQNKFSTDLRVNRKIKNLDSQRRYNKNMSPSLENLFISDKELNVHPVSSPFCDKQIDANSMNNKRVSGMTIRDSLEIFHRREDKQLCNMTHTQSPFTHCNEDLKNNREFLAPIKHYTGDDCSICDPIERDKQIRELLGVNKSSCFAPTSPQAPSSENDEYPLHCFYRKECEKRQLAEINLVKYCPILGSISKCKRRTEHTATSCCHHTCCRNAHCNAQKIYYADDYPDDHRAVKLCEERHNRDLTLSTDDKSVNENNQENSAFYQQLILNRNIQVFLQVEQFSKQRPIILSRKQYDKVKKTIQTTLSNKYKEKHKKFEDVVSDISVGEVRQRQNKDIRVHCNQQIQTELMCFKNSIQNTNKRPRMVSKVRYLARAPRSKPIREKFSVNNIDRNHRQEFGDLYGYYQDYPQKVSKEYIDLHQKTCQANIPYPRDYEQYKSRGDNGIKRQNQYEHLTDHRLNVTCVRSNDQREIQRNYENYIPNSVTHHNKACNNCGKFHIFKENSHLHIEEHRKQNDKYRQEPKQLSHLKEKFCFEIGDHRRFINKCGEHPSSGEESLKQNVNQSKFNREYHEDSREYSSKIRQHCIDCGKRYKPNKECCKVIKEQRKPNDIIVRDTGRHTHYGECNKNNVEYIKAVKEGIESKPYAIGLLGVSADDHPASDDFHRKSEVINVESKKPGQKIREHHKACGEYDIEYQRSQLLRLTRPLASGESQEDLFRDIGVNHSLPSHQNTEMHKINKVIEVHPTKKCGNYRLINKPEDVVLEQLFEERSKPHIECSPPIEEHENSSRGHLMYNATRDQNLAARVTHFEEEIYERGSRVSEQKPNEMHSDKSERFQDYFTRDSKTEEYFRQSVEYCRLDIENYRHIEEHQNSEKYIAETRERSGFIEQCDKQIENEELITTVMLSDTQIKQDKLEIDHTDRSTKKTVSSLEIHYTSVSYLKKSDSANSAVAVHSDSSLCHVNSIQTIFRGHRKSPTPNLGTSMYSLYSEDGIHSNKSTKYIMAPRDIKPNKRPFLRRLMSCLVMRSTKPSVLKLPISPAQEMVSVNSSVDSYHISTSLGAVEVSSSIYDTSASFYSNHAILPINSKIKRGFFNSVRGFLTNRKS